MISLDEARRGSALRLHPASRRHLFPYEGVGLLLNFIQSLAAIKEILFAFGAGCYLFVVHRRRRALEQHEAEMTQDRHKLDAFLNRTIEIETAQINILDPRVLRPLLNDVTRIKLQAIGELTNTELRADRMFLIFLTQCATLTAKLQAKLLDTENEQQSERTERGTAGTEEVKRDEVNPKGN